MRLVGFATVLDDLGYKEIGGGNDAPSSIHSIHLLSPSEGFIFTAASLKSLLLHGKRSYILSI